MKITMKGKTLIWYIFAGVSIFLANTGGLFGDLGTIIAGMAVVIIGLLMKRFSDTTGWIKGWSTVFMIVSIMAFVVDVIAVFVANQDALGLPPVWAVVFAKATLAINGLILAINTLIPDEMKDFDTLPPTAQEKVIAKLGNNDAVARKAEQAKP